MKIHPFVYLVVGTGIAVISKTIGTNMVLFLYLGIAFALFGIIRIVLESQKKKSKTPTTQPPLHNHRNHFVTRHHRVTQRQNYSMRYCQRCGNPMRRDDIFCSHCGQKVFR